MKNIRIKRLNVPAHFLIDNSLRKFRKDDQNSPIGKPLSTKLIAFLVENKLTHLNDGTFRIQFRNEKESFIESNKFTFIVFKGEFFYENNEFFDHDLNETMTRRISKAEFDAMQILLKNKLLTHEQVNVMRHYHTTRGLQGSHWNGLRALKRFRNFKLKKMKM